ncbi:MAG: hypothetical protein WCZ47_05325 [Bacilli bacterium]|jgi:hypothetical protein|nr:hypothetical protein [Erysipelotrichia bacterium]
MKRRWKFLTIFVSVFFLVGCDIVNHLPMSLNLDGEFPKGFLENNSIHYSDNAFKGFTKSEEFKKYDYVDDDVVLSYVIVADEDATIGVYDLESKKEALPLIFSDIMLGEVDYVNNNSTNFEDLVVYGALAFLVKEVDDEYHFSFYCFQEQKYLVPFANYDDFNLDISYSTNYSYTIETITLVENDVTSYIRYKVSFDDKQNFVRKALTVADDNYITQPEKEAFPVFLMPKLKEYEYEFFDTKMVGYKNDEKIFTVTYPDGALDYSFFFDKYFIIQTITRVADDAKKYDFINEGAKYMLDTSRIDLTNGKVKNYPNFEYVFDLDYFYPFDNLYLNNKQEFSYVSIDVNKIENKILLEEASVLFDANLKPLVNLTLKEFDPYIIKIGQNRYLTNYNKIVDENHDVILDLSNYNYVNYLPSVNLISLRSRDNYRYGLIKLDGKIVVPFEYRDPFLFFNDYAYNYNAIKEENRRIDANGHTQESSEIVYGTYGAREGITYSEISGVRLYKNYAGSSLFLVGTTENIEYGVNFYSKAHDEKIGSLYCIYDYVTSTLKYYILT